MNTFPGYMRATVFAPRRASFPAYVQPKHNGIRCITDGFAAWTREGNLHADHIQKLIRTLPRTPGGWFHDGELILPRHEFSFQQTQSAVAAENENSHLLTYPVFDTFNPGDLIWNFNARMTHAGVTCETHLVHNMAEVEHWYEDFLARGYEGLIFRMDTRYKIGSAGRDLMKDKPKDSAEFICIGVWEGRGKNVGVPTFRLARPDVPFIEGAPATKKNSFGAVPKGEYPEKKALWEQYRDHSCIGMLYTVEFADRYDSGCPQFPVGLGFREIDGGGYE